MAKTTYNSKKKAITMTDSLECKHIWEELGLWWDSSVEDGDAFHRAFVFPCIDKLLEAQGHEKILDAGCGNGALSRRIAKKGCSVFGVDFSSTLIKQARIRSQGITFKEIDLTDLSHLEILSKEGPFDHIVCSMVLHNLPSIHPFFSSLPILLKPDGSLIFSIPHPYFNSAIVQFKPQGALEIEGYNRKQTLKLKSKPGQPIEQYVFHRPFQEYVDLLLGIGMIMNGFEEPCVASDILPKGSLWAQYPDFPPALTTRWAWQNKK
jgi:2-polyprenyl-3-methyl-5-hydroxy-6-metoxy-1,4-benzoquinol methylase